ncbi:hypothetical protein DYB30_001493 [Aphanomyces astaci]|uniref:UBC core domain-containing protein n=2 Tax=Aphanomyces astaci TaxID=112090 RepID=A0A397DLT8_APHAT|nr:hypothetical protein DYB30_001493 [Aphanomyces astaci]RHZ22507.1 hypothetical protein DYB26_001774 [Aphanomyces astaci]
MDLATKRLRKEYTAMKKKPVENIEAVPLETNILEWHYVIRGIGLYEGGYYHGKLKFPPDYPMKPPSVYMITPSGRFESNVRLCLSMSDFHPETWNPLWSVSSILVGLCSFMNEDTPTTGSIGSTNAKKKALADERKWEQIARNHLELKPKSLRENEQLRTAVAEQHQLTQELEAIMLKKPRRTATDARFSVRHVSHGLATFVEGLTCVRMDLELTDDDDDGSLEVLYKGYAKAKYLTTMVQHTDATDFCSMMERFQLNKANLDTADPNKMAEEEFHATFHGFSSLMEGFLGAAQD